MHINSVKMWFGGLGLGLIALLSAIPYTDYDAAALESATTLSTTVKAYATEFCFGGQADEKDHHDIARMYVEKTNIFVNDNVEKLMSTVDSEPPSPPYIDDLEPGDERLQLCNETNGVRDINCQRIAMCKGDYSAYCLAVNMTGINPQKYRLYNEEVLKKDFSYLNHSYFCYEATMRHQLNAIDNRIRTEREKLREETGNRMIDEMNEVRDRNLEYGLTLSLFGESWARQRSEIEDELARAKGVLDVTVDTYAELRNSWKLHQSYVDIYLELVKYRDHLVDVRRSTDMFPLKFINASSTQCQ